MPRPRRTFKTSLFFDPVEIPPGEERVVYGRVDARVDLFRGELLVAFEDERGSTVIKTIEIGGRRQLPEKVEGISAVAFCPERSLLSSGNLFDTYDPRCSKALAVVRNISAAPVKWAARIDGSAIDEMDRLNAR